MNRNVFSLAPVALACLLTCHAYGQEQKLAPVNVWLSEQGSLDINPVVDAARIARTQAKSLQEVFAQTPEISTGGAVAGIQKLYLRGLSERLLALDINGARQGEAPYHHTGSLLIDPDLIKIAEVQAGTGAASAGPGALAGVLRLQSKNGEDLLRPGQNLGALIKYGAQSVNHSGKLSANLFGRLNANLDWLISHTQQHMHDYKAGGAAVPNTGGNSGADSLRLHWRSGAHDWQAGHEQVRDEGIRNQRSNLQHTPINPAEWQRSTRATSTLQYQWRQAQQEAGFTIWRNRQEMHFRHANQKTDDVSSQTEGLRANWRQKTGAHEWQAGLDYRADLGRQWVNQAATPDEQAKVAGLWLQHQWDFQAGWQSQIGWRADRYSYTDAKNIAYRASGGAPSFALSYSPNEQWLLRLSHSRALRGVGILEPYLKALYENAPGLHAERAKNTDFTAEYRSGPWQFGASLYRQQITDPVVYDGDRVNLGEVRVHGYSLRLAWQGKHSQLRASVSDARPSLDGKTLDNSTLMLLGVAGGRSWQLQAETLLPWAPGLRLGWQGRLIERIDYGGAQQSAPGFNGASQARPGYGWHDVYLEYPFQAGGASWQLQAGIHNVLDKYLVQQSSFGYHPRWKGVAGLPEAGRDLRITLSTRF
ncbi:TonB-dependent receptor [Massilia sp. W12]|uniref:TonB-dependent receptor domain-containing protein n=1 Tax=Massilia sp. W12 TaxID=3126507 RepID=UPI0030CC1D70